MDDVLPEGSDRPPRGAAPSSPDDGSPPIPPAIRTRGHDGGYAATLTGRSSRPHPRLTAAALRRLTRAAAVSPIDDQDRVVRGVQPDRAPQRAGPDVQPAERDRHRHPRDPGDERERRRLAEPVAARRTGRGRARTRSTTARSPRGRRPSAATRSARSPGTAAPPRPARRPRRPRDGAASPGTVPVGGSGLAGTTPAICDRDVRRGPRSRGSPGRRYSAPPRMARAASAKPAYEAHVRPAHAPRHRRPSPRARRRRPPPGRARRAGRRPGAGCSSRPATAGRPTAKPASCETARTTRKTRTGDGPA